MSPLVAHAGLPDLVIKTHLDTFDGVSMATGVPPYLKQDMGQSAILTGWL